MHDSKYTQMDLTEPERHLEPLLMTAEQAAVLLAICRTKVYELLRSGELESVQIGSSRRIPVASLSDFVVRLQARTRAQVESSSLPPTVH